MADAEVTGTLDGKTFQLSLDVMDAPNSCAVEIKLKFDADVAALSFDVSYVNDVATLTIGSMTLTGPAACLAACGITSAVGPIVQCAKTKKKLVDFKACVKSKGLSIVGATLECIVACLGVSASGAHGGP